MTDVVLLFSGGLDSTVLAYDLLDGRLGGLKAGRLLMLQFDYGQRHRAAELESARAVARLLETTHGEQRVGLIAVDLRGVGVLLPSTLTGVGDVPHGRYDDESMRSTVVPSRNAILLSAAYGVAVGNGYDAVACAAHAGDHPIYPDCRPEFFAALGHALRVGTTESPASPYVALCTPYVGWDKAQIVRRGAELGAPLAATWSCYEGRDRHCGRCGTCTERREAFQLAGVDDFTPYRGV